MRRPLVVPPRNPRGLLPLSVVVGFVSGAAYVGLWSFLTFVNVPSPPSFVPEWLWNGALLMLFIALAAAPPLVFGASLALRCRGWWSALLLCFVFSLTLLLTTYYVIERLSPNGYVPPPPAQFGVSLFWMMPGVIVIALLALLSHAIVRCRVIDADGVTCWRCAYPSGSPSITTCPECGAPIHPSQRRVRWVHALGDRAIRNVRSLRLMSAALAMGFGAGVLWRFVPHRFYSRFASAELRTTEIALSADKRGGAHRNGMAAVLRPISRSHLAVWIVYLPQDVPDFGAMQIRVRRDDSVPGVRSLDGYRLELRSRPCSS